MRHSTRQQRANGAMKYVGAFVRHPHSPSAFAIRIRHCANVAIRTCRCLFGRFRFMCFFVFTSIKINSHDPVWSSSDTTTSQRPPRSTALGIPSFMRFYLFIYSNKLQCQLNHHTLLVCCFSLSALFAVCYALACPPSQHSLTSAFASVGKLIFRLYRKSLFLFALECVVPLIATQ